MLLVKLSINKRQTVKEKKCILDLESNGLIKKPFLNLPHFRRVDSGSVNREGEAE